MCKEEGLEEDLEGKSKESTGINSLGRDFKNLLDEQLS